MAKKVNKVSITSENNIIKEHFDEDIVIDWYGVSVEIKKTIPLNKALEFTDDIVQNCYIEGDVYDYRPEIVDFVVRCDILQMYANFTMPKNTSDMYDFVYKTDAVETVVQYINGEQLDSIVNSALRKIDFLKEKHIAEIELEIQKMASDLGQVMTLVSDWLANISKEDIDKVTNFITDGGIDYEALLKAYKNIDNNDANDNDVNLGDNDVNDNKLGEHRSED